MAERAWHQASVREFPGVVAVAGRLILAHWPALLTLSLLGVAARNATLWAAVELSDWHGWAGQILLVMAPLGYLLPVIAMLHLCRSSLPAVSRAAAEPAPLAPTEGRERRLIDVSASVLIPFLAVYVSHGLLADDVARFTNEAAADESRQSLAGQGGDYIDRLGIWSEWTLLGIVALAWVLRWALGRFERRTNFLALAVAGAAIETYWTGQVAQHASSAQSWVVNWVEQRRSVHRVSEQYDAAVSTLGPFSDPVASAGDWLFGLLGAFDVVVIVPLAWLTVAGVVLGHRLMPPPATDHPLLDRMKAMPEPVRNGFGSLTADIRGRFSAFWQGLRMLGSAGLAPMLVFGIVFLLVLRVPALVSWLWRAVVGPVDTSTWLAFSPIESGLGLALSMALLAPLLAAAVEWLVRPSAGSGTPDAQPSRTSTASA